MLFFYNLKLGGKMKIISIIILSSLLVVCYAQDDSLGFKDTTEQKLSTFEGELLTVYDDLFVESPVLKYCSDAFIVLDSTIDQIHPITIVDALNSATGLYIKESSLIGSVSSPLIRGGTMSHQKVLIDGLPVSFPQLGSFDLNWFTIPAISRIELITGSWSSLYGTGGMAGGINFITGFCDIPGAKTKVDYIKGDNNLERLSVDMVNNFFNIASIHIGGTKLDTDGEIEDELSKLEDITAKITTDITQKIQIELFGQSHRGRINQFSFGSLGKQRDEFDLGVVHLNLLINDIILRVSGQYEKYRQKYSTIWSESKHNADVSLVDIRGSKRIGAFSPTIFMQTRNLSLESTQSGQHHGLNEIAFGIQSDINFKNFQSVVSIRYDKDIDANSGLSGGFGIRRDFGSNIFASATAGTGFRTPTPNDLWWGPEIFKIITPVVDSVTGDTLSLDTLINVSRGNENIGPEKSFSSSISAGIEDESKLAAITLFLTSYADLIDWSFNYIAVSGGADSAIWEPQNISDAKIIGLNINLKYNLLDYISIGASYTYLSAVDNSDNILPERPTHYFTVPIDFKIVGLDNDLKLGLRLNNKYVGQFKRTVNFEEKSITPGFMIDGSLSAKYKLIELFFNVKNLTDVKVETFDGRKTMGRNMYFGIGWEFID
jgi:outer membrane receptor protein involved in Fe transport